MCIRDRYVALLSFALVLCSASAQSLKVGIVDMNRVFAEYYKTKDADKVVNEQKEAAKKELDSINNDYKKLLDSYQKLAKEIKDPAIGEALRKKKTEDAQQVGSKARAVVREKLLSKRFRTWFLIWLKRKTTMAFLINQDWAPEVSCFFFILKMV